MTMTLLTAYTTTDPEPLADLATVLVEATTHLDTLATQVDQHRTAATDDDERTDLEHLHDLLAEAWAKAATAARVLATLVDVNDALTTELATSPEPAPRPCVAHYGPHERHGIDCATPAEWDAATRQLRERAR